MLNMTLVEVGGHKGVDQKTCVCRLLPFGKKTGRQHYLTAKSIVFIHHTLQIFIKHVSLAVLI